MFSVASYPPGMQHGEIGVSLSTERMFAALTRHPGIGVLYAAQAKHIPGAQRVSAAPTCSPDTAIDAPVTFLRLKPLTGTAVPV